MEEEKIGEGGGNRVEEMRNERVTTKSQKTNNKKQIKLKSHLPAGQAGISIAKQGSYLGLRFENWKLRFI